MEPNQSNRIESEYDHFLKVFREWKLRNRRRASRAKRGERGAKPYTYPDTRQELNKMYGHRASRAKRGERGTRPLSHTETETEPNLNETNRINLHINLNIRKLF